MGNLSKFVKTFMITQNKEEWPTYNFYYRTILKQIVKSSLLEPSFDFVFENTVNPLHFETGVREDLKRFFFHARTESARESWWKLKWSTDPSMEDCINSRDIYVKKGLRKIIEKLKKQPRNVDDLKAKQAERKPGLESIEWWSVLPSVLLPNAEMPYTWFSNLK